MINVHENPVPFEMYLNELSKEFEYLQNGGASYRIETATLSLEIAQKVKSFDLFWNKKLLKKLY